MSRLEAVLLGAVTPGCNKATINCLNVLLLALFLVTATCLVPVALGYGSWLILHVVALAFLAVALTASINWFVNEVGFTDNAAGGTGVEHAQSKNNGLKPKET